MPGTRPGMTSESQVRDLFFDTALLPSGWARDVRLSVVDGLIVSAAAAAKQTGIGLTLLPSFYAFGGFGGAPPAPGQRRFLNDPERFRKLVERTRTIAASLPDARVGIAPHSLRAVTPETLRIVVDAA